MTPMQMYLYTRLAIKKNNPRTYLHGIEDRKAVESDAVEEEKGVEAANVSGHGRVPVQGNKCAADHNHYRHYPHHRGPP